MVATDAGWSRPAEAPRAHGGEGEDAALAGRHVGDPCANPATARGVRHRRGVTGEHVIDSVTAPAGTGSARVAWAGRHPVTAAPRACTP
jgi:hypothetical protein